MKKQTEQVKRMYQIITNCMQSRKILERQLTLIAYLALSYSADLYVEGGGVRQVASNRHIGNRNVKSRQEHFILLSDKKAN